MGLWFAVRMTEEPWSEGDEEAATLQVLECD